MRYTNLRGACLIVAVMTFSVFVSTVRASELPTWVHCAEAVSGGYFSEDRCATINEESGKFTLEELSSSVAVKAKSKGDVTFADTKATGGELKVECSTTEKGTVGAGSTNEMTAVEMSSCSPVTGSCEAGKTVTVKALNLPWKGELTEAAENKLRSTVTASGSGPGYKLECFVHGKLEVVDECTGTTSTLITDNEAGGVESGYEKESAKRKCTNGGTGAGEVIGTDVIEQEAAAGLAAKAPFKYNVVMMDFGKIKVGNMSLPLTSDITGGPGRLGPAALSAEYNYNNNKSCANKVIGPGKLVCTVEIVFAPTKKGECPGMYTNAAVKGSITLKGEGE